MTRAPALRRIFASPGAMPSIFSGSIRESMHVSTARPLAARGSSPASRNSCAYASLAASTSANVWSAATGAS